MASLLDLLIFDAVYGSWILSLPLFTLGILNSGFSINRDTKMAVSLSPNWCAFTVQLQCNM